ncbi:TPA: hypothetical protein ACMHGH_001954 [Neisseria gonorrhoeae]
MNWIPACAGMMGSWVFAFDFSAFARMTGVKARMMKQRKWE